MRISRRYTGPEPFISPEQMGLPAELPSRGAVPRRSVSRRRKTILVVDDHPMVRDTFVRYLRGLGYFVLDAEGPREAQQLALRPGTIDLLLTDFRMPEMNGIELANWFRSQFPQTKVLVMSTAPWEAEPFLSAIRGIVLLEKAEAFSMLAELVEELL